MNKLALSSVCLSLSVILSACQSIDLFNKNEPATQVDAPVVDLKDSKQPQQPEKQYEQTPDLSEAEVLSVNNQNGIISDASTGYATNNQIINMQTAPDQVEQGVSLADNLEQAPTMGNAQTAAASSHDSVLESNETVNNQNLVFDQNAINQPSGYIPPRPAPEVNNIQNQNPYLQPATLDSACPTGIQNAANITANQLIKELVARLRANQGLIYVAPTIIDQEYSDCLTDLSPAIKIGLNNNQNFQLTSGNTNLNNVVSQNIGSATILPSLIHQCRAASIPYLVISQVKKSGENASLSIRIIRTEDGITLTQKYVRIK